jgi:hypothetical protein
VAAGDWSVKGEMGMVNNIEKISRVISEIDIRKECCLKTTATIIGLALFAGAAVADPQPRFREAGHLGET